MLPAAVLGRDAQATNGISMPEEIDCTSCAGRFAVKTFLRGMRVKCPHCGAQFGAQTTATESEASAVMPGRQVEPAIDLLSEPEPAWQPEPPRDEYDDVADDQTIVPAPLPPAPAAPAKKRRKVKVLVYRPKARDAADGGGEMTPGQKGALRFGISLAVFGLALLILPLFGIQFRKLANLGENA